jgi:divalent metal cation (Fe/Co/Zn/Cd) transporter
VRDLLGPAEDFGVFIVTAIALSAGVAARQAIDRLAAPPSIDRPGGVAAAGLIRFARTERVASYRIRVGRRIGSAALVAGGVHALTDGLTLLAVLATSKCQS